MINYSILPPKEDKDIKKRKSLSISTTKTTATTTATITTNKNNNNNNNKTIWVRLEQDEKGSNNDVIFSLSS